MMKSPFNSPDPVHHEVDGTSFAFYPPRTWTVSRLRGFLKPLFTALSTISASYETDIGREQVDETESNGSMRRRTMLQAIDPALARQRANERETAVATLIDNLSSQQAMRSLALLVADSMRDDFEKRPTDQELDDLLNEWTLDQLVQALHGVALASKELFAPLVKRVAPGLAALKERLAQTQAEEQPSEPQEDKTTTPSGES